MKTRRKRAWRWLAAGSLLAVVGAAATVALVLWTDPGRRWLADRLSRALSSDSLSLRIEGLRASRLTRVAVDRVALADPEGSWLEVRDAECRWDLRAFLRRRFEVRALHIGSLDMLRRPVGQGAKPRKDSPPRLPEFAAEAVEIGRLRVDAAVWGFPVDISDLRGRVRSGGLAGAARIGIDAQALRMVLDTVACEHVTADIELLFPGGPWGLSGSLAGGGFRISAELQFPGRGAWPTGTLEAETDAASGPAGDLWPGLSAGRFTFSWDNPPRQDGIEAAQAKASVKDLRVGKSAVKTATVQTQWKRTDARTDVAVEADARAEDVSIGELTVTGAEARVAGPWRALEVSGKAGGVLAQPFELAAAGRLRWDGDTQEMELGQAAASWAGAQARLTEPLQVRAQGDRTSIRGAARMEAFDLSSVSNAAYGLFDGRIAGVLRLDGTLAAPAFEGEVSCEGVVGRTGLWALLPPLEGSCRFSASGGVLRVSADARMAAKGADARLEARVPARVSLVPWKMQLDRDGDLSVDLRAGLDLALLNAADLMANSRIGGRLDLAVAHNGPVSGGAITGTCVLAGAEYENHALGTVIREGRLQLVSRGDALVIESGSATDGGPGRVSLSGRLRPDLAEGLPFELEIDGRKMNLLRRPDMEATVSGKLKLDGTVSRVRAEGDLQIDNAVVDLRNLRPPPPAELEPARPAELAAAARPRRRDPIALRLAVSMPGTLYVRGRSLDSAWAGDLVLEREGGAAGLSGYLEARRGTILFLKRPFKLSEGRIDFDGRWPPEPVLRLTAVFSRADLDARALVTGPARDPEITLTSEPPLPEDEILARILFGEDLSGLTPLQAISLASEAAKLRQIGGGGGFLGELQSAVGIDRVELRETGRDSAEPEVAVGKYLGDRSYVEMRSATASDSSDRARLYLEHELRPNIVLEAESGLGMRSGVGLFWKREY